LAVDLAGNVYVADSGNSTIRKITQDGVVTTLAGMARQPGSADGVGTAARFYQPTGVAADSAGNVYVADFGNDTIRKITPDDVVSTLAGAVGMTGSTDGTGTAARFDRPGNVAVDLADNVYVADSVNETIREISPAGVVTTLAGSVGVTGSTDGTGSAARFMTPDGVSVDNAGNVYVGDLGNDTVRKITPAGVVTTLAGTAGQQGSADGIGPTAKFTHVGSTAVDGAGNLYVADSVNDTIRKLSIRSVSAQSGLTGTTAVAISAPLAGLTPGTTIHFRAVATSAAGGTVGSIQSFTPSASTPTPTPTPTPAPTPTPTPSPSLVTISGVSLQKIALGKTKTEAIDVQFSGQVNAASADNLVVYTLATTPQGKKHRVKGVALGRAIYRTSTEAVMLIAKKAPLSLSPPLILTINANNLLDTLGRNVDGTGDGMPGGIYKAILSKTGAIRISAVEQVRVRYPKD
jgi:sugar lactone lactonase YvrE